MEVIGRDDIIQSLWKKLSSKNGLVLSANRRMGKTTIVQEMKRRADGQGYTAIYQDLEAVCSPGEFANCVSSEVMKLRGTKDKWIAGSSTLYDKFLRDGGIGPLKFGGKQRETEWKEILEKDISFLAKGKKPAILFWDEFPIMLSNIMRKEPRAAMDVLDKLRQLRQEYPNAIKMVFTGSIGIHLILNRLKAEGYGNMPLNDLAFEEIGPLEIEFAKSLASQLLSDEDIVFKDEELRQLVQLVDCIPFYVGELVLAVVSDTKERKPDVLLEECLTKSTGNWNLRHFEQRILQYYDKHPFAYKILDHIARCQSTTITEITATARLAGDIEENDVLALIQSLSEDQYFERTGETVEFRFQLIRRWWRIHRRCD